ncbi:MAG: site-specific integrase [Pseudomonadota bacterium]
MPIYRRAKSAHWWVRFSVGGVKTRRSSGTSDRAAAEEFETRLRNDLWRQSKLGEKPRYTWAEAVTKWQAEAQTRGRDRDRQRLEWFAQYLNDLPLSQIGREIIDRLRTLKATESSPSTANRHMALLRMILRKAHRDWDWIDRTPVVPMFRLERAEPRFLTRAQFSKLKKHLPVHLKDLAEFSVETGLRMRNATGLTWNEVDLRRALLIVPAARAKAGETLSLPLSQAAVQVLRRQKKVRGQDHVFLFRGQSYDDANGATFKAAAKQAGVPWLRWHDLRHTWASWHIQSGTPPHVLQELGGWASLAMVQRYAHLNPGALRLHVEHRKGTPTKERARSRT